MNTAIGDTRRSFLAKAFGAVAIVAAPPIVRALEAVAESQTVRYLRCGVVRLTFSDGERVIEFNDASLTMAAEEVGFGKRYDFTSKGYSGSFWLTGLRWFPEQT